MNKLVEEAEHTSQSDIARFWISAKTEWMWVSFFISKHQIFFDICFVIKYNKWSQLRGFSWDKLKIVHNTQSNVNLNNRFLCDLHFHWEWVHFARHFIIDLLLNKFHWKYQYCKLRLRLLLLLLFRWHFARKYEFYTPLQTDIACCAAVQFHGIILIEYAIKHTVWPSACVCVHCTKIIMKWNQDSKAEKKSILLFHALFATGHKVSLDTYMFFHSIP